MLLSVEASHHCMCFRFCATFLLIISSWSTEGVLNSAVSQWLNINSTVKAPPVSTKLLSGGIPHGIGCPPLSYNPCPGLPLWLALLTDCNASSCSSRPRPPYLEAPLSTGSCPTAQGKTGAFSPEWSLCKNWGAKLQLVGIFIAVGLSGLAFSEHMCRHCGRVDPKGQYLLLDQQKYCKSTLIDPRS